MKITGIAPWFGSKRTLAPRIVEELGPHAYYFEVCAGSMSVLLVKPESEHETAIDLHGALTNLALVIQNEESAVALFNMLQRTIMGDVIYNLARLTLADIEKEPPASASVDWAYYYFLTSWMGRNGVAGTARINYQIATRWTQGGGSGPLRFKSAVDSIPEWCQRLRNVHILRRDIFEVLPKIEDAAGVSIYADPPYLPNTVSGNSKYFHQFGPNQHEQLANELARFKRSRVVVSYYASPLLETLYPGWNFVDCTRHKHLARQNMRGKTLEKTTAPEVLILNGPEYGKAGGLF